MDFHPFAEKFPLLEGDEWVEFLAGIKKTKGVKSDPVLYRVLPDGKMQGLDGRNRHRACRELRIKCDMKKVTVPDGEVIEFIKRKNLHRRHMTAELRERLVIELRKEGESLRTIAATLGTSEATVRSDLKDAGAQKCAPDGGKVTGKDGKQYLASRGDADEDPILCSRCARIGSETPPGCPKCKEARQTANRKKAERSTSKRKQGQVLFDVKGFNDAYGYFLRQIDKIGSPFQAHNSKDAEAFREEIEKLKVRILDWRLTLANKKS